MFESMHHRLVAALGSVRESTVPEDGQALVEYALIVALIAVVAIAALALTGNNITTIFSNIASDL